MQKKEYEKIKDRINDISKYVEVKQHSISFIQSCQIGNILSDAYVKIARTVEE